MQVKLVQHTYSCLYGTFLCNNAREREAKNLYKRTCSVWSLLRSGNKNFQNFLYIPSHDVVRSSFLADRASDREESASRATTVEVFFFHNISLLNPLYSLLLIFLLILWLLHSQ